MPDPTYPDVVDPLSRIDGLNTTATEGSGDPAADNNAQSLGEQDLKAVVEALMRRVGTSPSTDPDSLAYRLATMRVELGLTDPDRPDDPVSVDAVLPRLAMLETLVSLLPTPRFLALPGGTLLATGGGSCLLLPAA